ncbi:MAG: response regulator [Anaerolineae bacterium]|nr:response regulator [Anaerolineae bacterium]
MASILVVDDDVRVCKMIEDVLKGQGHFVVSAHNGFDGLEKARQISPDLVILDVRYAVGYGPSLA